MGEDEQPVLELTMPFIPIAGNLQCRIVEVDGNLGFQGFCTESSINFLSFSTGTSTCTGATCGRLGLLRQGRVQTKCSCIQMNGRGTSPLIAIDLKITSLVTGESVTCYEFSSKWFAKTYLFTGSIPTHVTEHHFNDFNLRFRIIAALNNIFQEITEWRVTGWVKPGTVDDQATASAPGANPYNNAQAAQRVDASRWPYHVVRIEPRFPENVDVARMNSFKIDLGAHFAA